jgi:hypothetical protein
MVAGQVRVCSVWTGSPVVSRKRMDPLLAHPYEPCHTTTAETMGD